ncbi:MAG: CaiB/BaiF CoA-transferase family protein [Hyphomonadaceae bacterium]|nr:CaiB/BaiF CoA-transferase family protein [Hyphomonadaceae bacterium]
MSPPPSARTGALSDLRVIELGQLIAGPFCGQMFADHGADVIKIEPPGEGDPIRTWGKGAIPVWWTVAGRNKRCVTVNLRTPEGRAIARRLIAQADVLIENFRPGTLEKWGMGYEALAADNPRLVMVRVSGYGQTGPYAPRAGYASVGEALGGMRHLCGEPDRPPSRAGLSLGDTLAASFAFMGALMALRERERSGVGQVVDAAIYESVLAVTEALVPEYAVNGEIRGRSGSKLAGIAPSNVYPCADGDILIAANQDSVFDRLCTAMARRDLATDPRFVGHRARGAHQDVLDEIIAAWTQPQSVAQVEALMVEHGVPAGRIYRAPDMLADPHYAARAAIVPVEAPGLPDLKMQNVFPKLSRTPGAVRWAGPALGAHCADVFAELLGADEAQIEAWREAGAI